jgi:hypothetical protein
MNADWTTDLQGSTRINREMKTYPSFDVEGIALDDLLREWRWLVAGNFSLLAVNAFGDLFLADTNGRVHRLDITAGTVSEVASTLVAFRQASNDIARKNDWFLEELAGEAEQRGLSPRKGQCVGYKIPPMFKESTSKPDNAYVADLYEYVSFMGDLHQQISDVPDGGQVRIKIQPRPKRS